MGKGVSKSQAKLQMSFMDGPLGYLHRTMISWEHNSNSWTFVTKSAIVLVLHVFGAGSRSRQRQQ